MVNLFYAFVPSFDGSANPVANSRPRLQSRSNATNEMWMSIYRYGLDTSGKRNLENQYLRCALWNATYDVDFEWISGIQQIKGTHQALNEVQFPNETGNVVSDMSQHAYSAVFWALADQLVGQMTWFHDEKGVEKQNLVPEFGVIDSPIQHTSLLGSSDLDLFFDLNKNNSRLVYENHTVPVSKVGELSPQRVQDKNLAQNKTLMELVENFSFNLTISLMHNEYLTSVSL